MSSITSNDFFDKINEFFDKIKQKYEEGMDMVFVGRRGLSEFRIEHHGPVKNNNFMLYGMDVIYCDSIDNVVLIDTSVLGTIHKKL